MMNTRVERIFSFAIYTALVISGLQIITTVMAKPLPSEGASDTNNNATTELFLKTAANVIVPTWQ